MIPLTPPPLVTPDTCYILSFAIIMLNTSLHNPCVKDKTTLERFISMNKGINNGGNLPDDLLLVRTTGQSQCANKATQIISPDTNRAKEKKHK